MSHKRIFFVATLVVFALLLVSCQGIATPITVVETVEVEKEVVVTATPIPGTEGEAASVVEAGDLLPPVMAEPCGDDCPFAGQTVTVIVNAAGDFANTRFRKHHEGNARPRR